VQIGQTMICTIATENHSYLALVANGALIATPSILRSKQMNTHAQINTRLSISERLAQLPELPMASLWAMWDEHFDERPHHHHRTWIESRLAYRIQEREFGGLNPRTKKKLQEIGKTGQLPRLLRTDADRLTPGTVLSRIYNDEEHRVTVHGVRNFEYRGRRFKSLSALARAITGMSWSGPLFFGLKDRKKVAK
jgi:hypothetical protein